MEESGLMITVLAASLTFLILSVGFILLIHFFNKSKAKAMMQKQEREIEYLNAIKETEHEIQNVTLNSVGRDLHDNVGQILTVAKIRLSKLRKGTDSVALSQTEDLVVRAIQEIRVLAKSLNADRIKDVGLHHVIESEADRVNAIEGMECNVEISGDVVELEPDRGVVAFRVIQEFISNTLKHAQASVVGMELLYRTDDLLIKMVDNGIGIQNDISTSSGSGIRNMKNRAQMMGGSLHLTSSDGKGTMLEMTIPYAHE